MSKIKYFLIAIMAIFLASCKGGDLLQSNLEAHH